MAGRELKYHLCILKKMRRLQELEIAWSCDTSMYCLGGLGMWYCNLYIDWIMDHGTDCDGIRQVKN